MFDIIICTYNGEKVVHRAIQSVLNLEGYSELVGKFIIVNNNSTDNTNDVLTKFSMNDDSIECVFERLQGLAFARRAGVKRSSSDWLLFVDDDNVLDKAWLSYAVKYISDNPNVGAFNGSIVPEFSFRLTKEEENNLAVGYMGLALTHIKTEDIDFQETTQPSGGLYGAGLALNGEIIRNKEKVNWTTAVGRCGTILSSGEDTEMVAWITELGLSIGYEPRCQIRHIIPRSRLQLQYLKTLHDSFRYTDKSLKTKLRRIARDAAMKLFRRSIEIEYIKAYLGYAPVASLLPCYKETPSNAAKF